MPLNLNTFVSLMCNLIFDLLFFPQEFHLRPSPGGPEHAAGADVDTDVPAPARPQVPGLPGHDAGQMVRIVIFPQDDTGTLIGWGSEDN